MPSEYRNYSDGTKSSKEAHLESQESLCYDYYIVFGLNLQLFIMKGRIFLNSIFGLHNFLNMLLPKSEEDLEQIITVRTPGDKETLIYVDRKDNRDPRVHALPYKYQHVIDMLRIMMRERNYDCFRNTKPY